MYQVSFKLKTPFRKPYYDCVFYDSEEDAVGYSNFLKAFDNYSDIRITPNTIDDLMEANEEIIRLRKLLLNSYVELQQLKEGYNEFISREREREDENWPLIRGIFNINDNMIFCIRYKGKIVRICVPKTEFTSPVCVPDFEDHQIIDDGHTARFGTYEASAEAILDYKDK